jgi:hypothetical protein
VNAQSTRRWRAERVAAVLVAALLALAAFPVGVAAAGAADHLAWTPVPPTTGTTNVGTLAVSIVDQYGNVVTLGASATVTLSADHTVFACTSAGGLSQTKSSGLATFTFTGCSVTSIGVDYTITATLTGSTTLATGPYTITTSYTASSGPATQLAYTTQPAGGTAGSTWTVGLALEDSSGNVVTSNSSTVVTLAISTNPGGGTLTCTPSATSGQALSGGTASFSCSINKTGVGYKLTASAASLTATSNTFTITAGAPYQLAWTSYPAVPPASTPTSLSPNPAVSIVDQYGNVVTLAASATITLGLNTTVSPTGATLSCTSAGGLAQTRTNGYAATFTFSGCVVSKTGYYALKATLSGATTLASGATNPIYGSTFSVTGVATSLAFTSQPTGGTAGIAWTQPVIVALKDAYGNIVSSDSSTQVSLAISTNPAGGTLTCTNGLTQYVSMGVATFTGCSVNRIGTGYTLRASTPYNSSIAAATSSAFNIVAGAPTQLGFTTQPSNVAVSQSFPVAPVVAVQDAGGNTITSGTGSTTAITLSLGSNPGGGVLTCTGGRTVVAVSGVARFTGCSISQAGTGYTLVATASGLSTATSVAFNVLAVVTTITLRSYSPVMNNGAILWGQGVDLISHTSVPYVQFQIQTTLDQVTWGPLLSSTGSPLTFTTDAAGNATYHYTPIRNYWYRAVVVGGGAAPSNVVRVTVRQLCLIRPNPAGTTTLARGTSITYRVVVRPARPDLVRATTLFQVWQRTSAGWRLYTQRSAVIDAAGNAYFTWTFSSPGTWYVRSRAQPTPVNANSFWTPAVFYRVP